MKEIADYNAGIALAPNCIYQFAGFMTAIPNFEFLAIMGENDEFSTARPCVDLFQKAKAQGNKVDFSVIAKASHGFSTIGTTFDPSIPTARGCADDPLVYSGPDKKIVSISGKKEFGNVRDALAACRLVSGASIGGARDAVPVVISSALSWLKARGW